MGLSSSKMTKSNINVVHRIDFYIDFFLKLYKGFMWGSDWNLLNENPDICLSCIWCITWGHERTLISWINCSFDFNLFIESLHLILKNSLNDSFAILSSQIYHMNNLHSYLYLVPILCNFMEKGDQRSLIHGRQSHMTLERELQFLADLFLLRSLSSICTWI